ncbi:MAG: BatD family protein [Myxococcota bacterium]|nr:BatD family protein [Myxococcota bacterium]
MVFGAQTMERGQSAELVLELQDLKIERPPLIPADEGLRIQSRSPSPSRIFKMINGQSTSILRYRYKVVALEEGEWRLGPASVRYQGRSYVAPSQKIQVLSPSQKTNEIARVEAFLSESHPYEGEVVSYRFRYEKRGRSQQNTWNQPSLSNWDMVSGLEIETQKNVVLEGGRSVEIFEWHVPLKARQEGRYEIGPGEILVSVPVKVGQSSPRRFFLPETELKRFNTDILIGNVRPLPPAPTDYSGLVGVFQLRAYPSKRVAKVGEAIEVVLELWGNGVIEGYRWPAWTVDSMEVHDDEPQYEHRMNEGLYASKMMLRRVVIPLVEGKQVLPPLQIRVFNPKKEEFELLESDPFSFQILKGENTELGLDSFQEKESDSSAVSSSELRSPPSELGRSVAPWWIVWPFTLVSGLWLFRRKKAPQIRSKPVLPGKLPIDRAKRLAIFSSYFDALCSYCEEEGSELPSSKVVHIKEQLYLARYGGAEIQDLEKELRALGGA